MLTTATVKAIFRSDDFPIVVDSLYLPIKIKEAHRTVTNVDELVMAVKACLDLSPIGEVRIRKC